jgi:hypothetical protein
LKLDAQLVRSSTSGGSNDLEGVTAVDERVGVTETDLNKKRE